MGRKVAHISVSKAVYAIDKPYTYLIPPELEARLQPGMRVLVPFGSGNRCCDGIVLSICEERSTGVALKAIFSCLDEQPVLDQKGLQLALWMRERYFCTVYDCVKAMLPAGLYFSLRDRVVLKTGLVEKDVRAALKHSHSGALLFDLLLNWGGSGDMEQIRTAFGTKDPNSAIRTLVGLGFASLETSAQRGVGDKTEKIAVLAVPVEEAMAFVTPKRKTAPLQYSVTEMLCTLGVAGAKELCYFTGASMQTLKSLEKSGILSFERQEVFRRPSVSDVPPALPPVLNDEQQSAFDGLSALLTQNNPCAALLYGITGSGKTSVYIRLIQQTLDMGQAALVLVPEIALTPQLLRIFTAHFGKQIAVLHSSLRSGERYDEWKRAKNGNARVIIGTRSAIFAPVQNLGLIILDEEQEPSYKSENVPRYHARDIAKFRCVQERALLVFGSATPSVETMYQAKSGAIQLFTLKKRYNKRALPDVIIADMKEELRQGNTDSISSILKRELEINLERGEQSILFLNRRGSSRMVSCGECGHVPECPNCSVSLTYHSANNRLMCHHCGHSSPLPGSCPKCGGLLNFVGTGTQKVQEELKELFPWVETLRMDTDTVSASHPHEELLDKFRTKKTPIMVGTQMVAKGLDFENVTLVGVVAPDLSLYVDDFRASERTFSLLTQVIGRAGRGEKQGRAVIQTYTPEHEVIRYSAVQDYDAFYNSEIELRRLRGQPPFSDVIRLTASGKNEGEVLRILTKIRHGMEHDLKSSGVDWQLYGPAPNNIAKVNNRYRYHLTYMGQVNRYIRQLIGAMICAAHCDKENRGVSVYADWKPTD